MKNYAQETLNLLTDTDRSNNINYYYTYSSKTYQCPESIRTGSYTNTNVRRLLFKEITPGYMYYQPNILNFINPLKPRIFLRAALPPSEVVAPLRNPIVSFASSDLRLRRPAISLIQNKKLQQRSNQLLLLSSCRLDN